MKSFFRVRKPLSQIFAVAIGIVFLWSAVPKLLSPLMFLMNVYDYALFSPPMGVGIAFFVPYLELVLGVCLVFGVLKKAASVLSETLFIAFVVLQSSALWRGLQIACGCMGSSGDAVSVRTLGRTVLLLAVCSFVLLDELLSDEAPVAQMIVNKET